MPPIVPASNRHAYAKNGAWRNSVRVALRRYGVGDSVIFKRGTETAIKASVRRNKNEVRWGLHCTARPQSK